MSGADALIDRALAASRADDCLVIVERHATVNTRWAGNSLTTNGVADGSEVTVVAVLETDAGPAVGSVTRSGVTEAEIPDLVAAAERAAAEAGPADDVAALLGGRESADFADAAEAVTPADLADLAPRLGEVFARAAADGVELFGYAEHESVTTWLASSTGLRLRSVQPATRVEMTGKSHGRTRSAWAGRSAGSFGDVAVADLYAEIAQGLGWQARTVDVAPGRHPVLLTPGAMADLMIYLYWSADGREAAEGRNAFSATSGTRLGETLSPRALRLYSDPAEPGLECADFLTVGASGGGASVFDNGAPLAATDWVHDGRLAALWQTRAAAVEHGQVFSPTIGNLVLRDRDGHGDLTDLIGRSSEGLLVNCLWYIRLVDPRTLLMTGLTRDGVYVVEGGEVVGATNNFRFNESPLDLLGRLQDAGATEVTMAREWADWFPRVAMPAVSVADFNMSTVSQAS